MLQNEERSSLIPTYNLRPQTIIYNKDNGFDAIEMCINGVVVLPIGAQVELSNPNRSVYVVGIRLLAPNPEGDNAACVCLDVSKNKPRG